MSTETTSPKTNAAEEVAQELLYAFERVDGSTTDESEDRVADLLRSINSCRRRLQTLEADESARPVASATEALLDACDEVELMRKSGFDGADTASGEPGSDYRSMVHPGRATIVKTLLAGLKDVLAGKVPVNAESLLTSVSQGVSHDQACQMHGLTLPDGSSDLASLDALVERVRVYDRFYRDDHGEFLSKQMNRRG